MRLATLLALAWLSLAVANPAAGQARFSLEAIEEIRSLTLRADVDGGPDNGQVARLLTDVLREVLVRADILAELPDPRADECCVLRADVRLATGAGRARFGVGYVVRLELGYVDRFGNIPAWTLLWTSLSRSNIVERAELTESLRAAVRELAGDFADRYRERFPRR